MVKNTFLSYMSDKIEFVPLHHQCYTFHTIQIKFLCKFRNIHVVNDTLLKLTSYNLSCNWGEVSTYEQNENKVGLAFTLTRCFPFSGLQAPISRVLFREILEKPLFV